MNTKFRLVVETIHKESRNLKTFPFDFFILTNLENDDKKLQFGTFMQEIQVGTDSIHTSIYATFMLRFVYILSVHASKFCTSA